MDEQDKLDPSIRAELTRVLQKDPNDLTDEDKGFLRAREHYLSKSQKDDYSDVLSEKVKAPALPTANDGGTQETPEAQAAAVLNGRDVEQVPTKQLNKLAVIYGVPEASKKNRQELIDALKTKLGPAGEEKPE